MVEPSDKAVKDDAAVSSSAETAGLILLTARERAGLSRADVAEQMNLLPNHVAALEENHYAFFPGETFVKGHLRSYARLLKINVDEVLRAYGASVPDKQSPAAVDSVSMTRPLRLEEKISLWKRYSGVAAAGLILAALWAWQQQRDHAQVLSLTTAADNGANAELGSAFGSDADAGLLDSVQLLPAEKRAATPSPQAIDAGATTAAVASNVLPAAGAAEVDQLSLHFSADCWIEIRDRDNKVLVAALKHSDEKLQIEGRGPFKVLLGYAPGVEMAYNGTPVKVDSSSGRSARLIVGNS